MRTVHVTAKIQIPTPPNFLRDEDGNAIGIEAIEESGLRQIGKEWTEELVERAKQKAKDKKQSPESITNGH